ncbi:MAG: type I methionyl aminopeptidase [Planctomycetaceae bacterium]
MSPLKKKIPLYTEPDQIEKLKAACRFNAQLMDFLRPHVQAGTTTLQLDQLAHEYTLDHGHTPACLGYHGYPKTICTSVNEVVCHGIPNDTPLQDGDIVNVDITTIVNGWFGDQSETFMIGDVSPAARRLVQTTYEALFLGIRACKPNAPVSQIGRAIQTFARKAGYAVVREYQGHGIGQEFHQEPGVPHFPTHTSNRDLLKPGTCFTVEPMLNIGGWKTKLDKRDGWTVRTMDRSLSAQFEHTVLMTESGPEILTLTENGPQEGDVL